MKFLNPVASPWRAAVLAVVLTGALAASASAAVSELTIDPTAQLSPGRLQATLTGTVTCDPGTTAFLDGQIVQAKNASGYGYTQVTCDGTAQAYAIDVRAGGFFSPGVFKAGKASARVSTFHCDPLTWRCSTLSTDAIIRLTK